MCKSRDYVFVPSFELRIGFFEKEHPQSSLLRFDESCTAGIILENWDKVINHDLFGLAWDTDVQLIDSQFVEWVYSV